MIKHEILQEIYKICSPYTSYDQKAKELIKIAIDKSDYADKHKADMKIILETARCFDEFCTKLGQYILVCMLIE